MTRLALAAILILEAFFMSEAMAQGPVCAPYGVFKNRINQSGEILRWRGFSAEGQHIAEVFIDDKEGSDLGFTIIVRRATDGMACLLFSGFHFEDVRGDTPWRVPSGEDS